MSRRVNPMKVVTDLETVLAKIVSDVESSGCVDPVMLESYTGLLDMYAGMLNVVMVLPQAEETEEKH